jgi:hypothetical protein
MTRIRFTGSRTSRPMVAADQTDSETRWRLTLVDLSNLGISKLNRSDENLSEMIASLWLTRPDSRDSLPLLVHTLFFSDSRADQAPTDQQQVHFRESEVKN